MATAAQSSTFAVPGKHTAARDAERASATASKRRLGHRRLLHWRSLPTVCVATGRRALGPRLVDVARFIGFAVLVPIIVRALAARSLASARALHEGKLIVSLCEKEGELVSEERRVKAVITANDQNCQKEGRKLNGLNGVLKWINSHLYSRISFGLRVSFS